MGALLQFRPSTRSQTERERRSQPGEIVIFPGVRIERHAEVVSRASDGVVVDPFAFDGETPVSRTN
jgi:hypothetical protein